MATILGIRSFLALTGYPKFGGGSGLHIAHVLVGGAFMLLALVILLSFLSKRSRYLAAIAGGFGFGAFIDEMGKFVTIDNDYFFRPTVGLIYITFILLYFLIKRINCERILTEEERLVNVLEICKQAVLKKMDAKEQQLALDLLFESRISHPLSQELKSYLGSALVTSTENQGVYRRIKLMIRKQYLKAVRAGWLLSILIVFFVLQALLSLLVSLDLTVGMTRAVYWTGIAAAMILVFRYLRLKRSKLLWTAGLLAIILLASAMMASFAGLQFPPLPALDVLQIGFSMLAGLLAVAGVFMLQKDRLRGYGYLRSSVLVHILFVQVFTFFDVQFWGLLGLIFYIFVLGALRYMMGQEIWKDGESLGGGRDLESSLQGAGS